MRMKCLAIVEPIVHDNSFIFQDNAGPHRDATVKNLSPARDQTFLGHHDRQISLRLNDTRTLVRGTNLDDGCEIRNSSLQLRMSNHNCPYGLQHSALINQTYLD